MQRRRKIETLDDQERTLQSHHLVITNGTKALAVAGVMGGADSEVTNETVNVLIESAYFAGQTVRRTSKDLGLRSESSARFEKESTQHVHLKQFNMQLL